MMSHNQALQQTTAKYPINRIDCKVVTVPRGNMSGNQPNIFQGILPNRIVIGMVDADAFNGTYAKNPSILRITIRPRWVSPSTERTYQANRYN